MSPSSHSPNRNTLWARALVDELARAGVREAVIAPGSRSTPMVLAFHDDPRIRTWTHLDERSAAFFALGMGKASGRPAAVVTTSGTAVANLFPAVVEAARSEAPLLLLTADRPLRLRGTDANQTVDQVEIFGGYPRAFFDLGDPVVDDEALRRLRATACRAVGACLGLPAGPVQVNASFDKPLEPVSVPGDVPEGFEEGFSLAVRGRDGGVPFREVEVRRPAPDPQEVGRLAEILRGARRGLVVAGPVAEPWRVGPALRAFSRTTGYPLVADPLSGGRYGASDGAPVLGSYDLVLRQEALWARLAPEVVVRVGRAPTSAALGMFLGWAATGRVHGDPGLPTILVDAAGLWDDHLGLVTHRVGADPVLGLEALAGALEDRPGDPAWAERWVRADARAEELARKEIRAGFSEGTILAHALEAAGSGAGFFVGSSMPVRDLDAFGPPRDEPLVVVGNRGASGIDGSVSTALGMAVELGRREGGSSEPVVAVLGDVAFLHDLNGLLVAKQVEAPVVLVVIQNDGGGIFHMLPIREHEPAFTRHFATPHGRDLARAAALHGIPHERVAAGEGSASPEPDRLREALRSAVERARTDGGIRILEIASDREENRRRHQEVVAAVRDAMSEASQERDE